MTRTRVETHSASARCSSLTAFLLAKYLEQRKQKPVSNCYNTADKAHL